MSISESMDQNIWSGSLTALNKVLGPAPDVLKWDWEAVMGSILNAECVCGYKREGLFMGAGDAEFRKGLQCAGVL